MLRFVREASYLMTPMYKQNSNCLISFHAAFAHSLTHSFSIYPYIYMDGDSSVDFLCTHTKGEKERVREKSFLFYNERISNICYSSPLLPKTKYLFGHGQRKNHVYLCGGNSDMHSLCSRP